MGDKSDDRMESKRVTKFYDMEGREVAPEDAVRAEVSTYSKAGSLLEREYFSLKSGYGDKRRVELSSR